VTIPLPAMVPGSRAISTSLLTGHLVRFVFCVLVCAGLLSACQGNGNAKRPVRIGLSMDTYVVERWSRDRDVFLSRAGELGAEVTVQVANEDSDIQAQQIDWLLDRGIDVLVVVPNDTNRIGASIRKAKSRGIPVISYDRLARNAGSDLYLSFDNVKVGELMMQAVADRLKTGTLVIVNGSRHDNNSYQYNDGIKLVLEPLIVSGRFHLLQEIWPEDWSAEQVEVAFEETLRINRHVDAVVCANDLLAEGIIQVLAEHRKAQGVVVTGMDADLAACQRIAEGSQTMTIYKPIAELASLAAESAVHLARHEPITTDSTVPDGTANIPQLLLLPRSVDRTNLQATVIRDGFHSWEDVYHNIPESQRPKQ